MSYENQVKELKIILSNLADVVNSMIDPEEKQPTVNKICPRGHARVNLQLFYYCPMCMKLYTINEGSKWNPVCLHSTNKKEVDKNE